MSSYDAILIPGGGIQADGTPHPWVENRLARAMERDDSCPIVCLSGFTPFKAPALDRNRFPITEAVASTNWLLREGVDPGRLFSETSSWDTIGNAYFARVIHTDVRAWRHLLIITSQFHLPRTQAVFEHVFQLPSHDGTRPVYRLEFEGTADRGLSPNDLRERVQKERRGLETWKGHIAAGRFTTLPELHRWLYAEHGCYRAGREASQNAGAAVTSY